MKFYKKSLLFLVPMLFMLLMMNSCNSCSNKKDEPKGPQPTEFEEAMTAKDTTAVKQLVDQFFSYVKEKNFSEAAGMLYRNDEDPNHEPQQLNNEEMAEVRGMLESVPMVDYRIEYIKFDENYQNEVLCHVIIKKAEGDMPEMSTKMFFKPVNYMGNWLLCLTNTEYGDKGVVNPDKRDSVQKDFEKKQKPQAEPTEENKE